MWECAGEGGFGESVGVRTVYFQRPDNATACAFFASRRKDRVFARWRVTTRRILAERLGSRPEVPQDASRMVELTARLVGKARAPSLNGRQAVETLQGAMAFLGGDACEAVGRQPSAHLAIVFGADWPVRLCDAKAM